MGEWKGEKGLLSYRKGPTVIYPDIDFGTHLLKNCESQSRTKESQLKKASPKLKMLGPLCNQTVNLKTDSKTLYYSILKLKYSPSILKQNEG